MGIGSNAVQRMGALALCSLFQFSVVSAVLPGVLGCLYWSGKVKEKKVRGETVAMLTIKETAVWMLMLSIARERQLPL